MAELGWVAIALVAMLGADASAWTQASFASVQMRKIDDWVEIYKLKYKRRNLPRLIPLSFATALCWAYSQISQVGLFLLGALVFMVIYLIVSFLIFSRELKQVMKSHREFRRHGE